MRLWQAPTSSAHCGAHAGLHAGNALGAMVARLGEPGFAAGLLQELAPVLPAASFSVYRTGAASQPMLFMSASCGIPDTTRDCWRAYLSGPHRSDRTWGMAQRNVLGAHLCHLTASEAGREHRARVYEAHGMAERVSVVERETDGSVFAVNFYRHQHQSAFQDRQISDLEPLAPVLLALARKHIALVQAGAVPDTALDMSQSPSPGLQQPLAALRQRLVGIQPGLTGRELDVCSRLLQGMTQEGIAADLGLALPTVKTYRNRAFDRLGIHFRNELFALALAS